MDAHSNVPMDEGHGCLRERRLSVVETVLVTFHFEEQRLDGFLSNLRK